MEERIARIEGILEQMNERLNHFGTEMGDLRTEMDNLRKYVETELRSKADKWEIRIWFIILIAVISVSTSLILG